jgi:hypothetical protein
MLHVICYTYTYKLWQLKFVITFPIKKNGVFWDVTQCGSVRTDDSEEFSASIIRVTRIGELEMLAIACVGCYLKLTLFLVHRLLSP